MSEVAILEVLGETLLLHPERAVIWQSHRTIIVADTHFGKSAIFGQHGVATPAGSDDQDRQRLTRLVIESEAHQLIVLGDFVHSPLAVDSQEARDLEEWSSSLRPAVVQVIVGNHDRGIAKVCCPSVQWLEEDKIELPFRFTHDAAKIVRSDKKLFTLSGHIHPVVRLKGLRKTPLRVPVFWKHSGGLILPSFGVFTGGFIVTPAYGDQIFAVSPDRVVPFPVQTGR